MRINLKFSAFSGAALVAGFLALQACSEDFLDRKPESDLTTGNFYTSADDAIAALTAAYDPLQWELTTLNSWQFGDVVGGDTDKGSTDDQDYAQIAQLANFTARGDNSELNFTWEQAYDGIYRSNLVLERVPEIEMDETQKNQILGQAKFLRAIYYFYLVRTFGRVPNITTVLEPTEVYVSRAANIKENWDQIEKDLTEAIAALPVSWTGANAGRATKGAAQSLLARVYLYQSTANTVYFTAAKWKEAADLTDAIIASGTYTLDPNYARVFTLEGEDSREIIFAMQAVGGTTGWNNDNEGQALNQWIAPRTTDFSGWGFSTPIGPNTPNNYAGNSKIKTNNIVEAYEACDPRLKANILGTDPNDELFGIKYNYQKDSDKPGQYKLQPWSRTGYNIRKYMIPESALGAGGANSPLNVPLIRYAEVLLINAEAHNELGNSAKALTSLNAIRNRADNITPSGSCPAPVTTTNQAQLRDAIMQERRLELAFEGHRFFDLVRTNRAEAFLNAMGRPFKKGVNDLFPIPQGEINRNPNLEPNPWQ
ncbi:RagB/SusD family nutrient uptake outer membrane protein [Adhaeribacter rhizoryzae]|uniref:RagB/SusD family nutrient uptake outer membrane protein n=1 Tax=Adhaeribacter rhizoryzae TaxID=2607907 RepID=A0A5M6DSN2_9BACT|nr:RagB/SusD family nutrient uptake outer membrane protein [Adhaeribacter rhizoryzae]KAA5549130.1 RagB/SusD family nutrient uptake outer membrane protein [Adhaeribacter rhizoryzae]